MAPSAAGPLPPSDPPSATVHGAAHAGALRSLRSRSQLLRSSIDNRLSTGTVQELKCPVGIDLDKEGRAENIGQPAKCPERRQVFAGFEPGDARLLHAK